jgi:hypothetical protein
MHARLLALPDRLAAAVAARPVVWRVAVGVLLVLILAATVLTYFGKIQEPSRDGTYTRSAFLRWRGQIEDLDRGVDIYAAHNYPNPPIMALILRPFVALPPYTGAVAWLLLKAALAGVMFVWVLRLTAEPGKAFPPLAACVVGVLSLHPILGDLQHGNVNIFIAFLVFASLELFRRGRDLTAGLVLALAIACKVTPALFVVYFGWKGLHAGWVAVRERTPLFAAVWKSGGAVLAGCLVGLAVWLLLVPGVVLGFERNVTLLKSWYAGMVKPFVEEGKVTSEHANQSIPGLAFRLLTHEPSELVYDDDNKPVPNEYRNLIDIGPGGAKWVVRGWQAAFVLALVLLARAPIAVRRQGVWFAAECGFIVLGMLLFSERTWKHHATTTALPFAALVGCWAFRPTGRGLKVYLFATLAAAALLMNVPSLLDKDPLGNDPQDDCLVYGTHTAAFVLLTAGLGVVMWVCRRPTDQAIESE